MKSLFAVLFCTFVMVGPAFADELSYEIDPIATAKAPWKVGEKIIKEGDCQTGKLNREFLGVTQSGFALLQDFYLSGERLTNPFLTPLINAENSCRKGLEGILIAWHKNGQKYMEGNYENGEQEGLITVWYENGQKQMEGSYENGKLEGVLITWHKNGQKQMEANLRNGEMEGPTTTWHENGQKLAEGHLKNNSMVGIWRWWDEKGNLIEEKDQGVPRK